MAESCCCQSPQKSISDFLAQKRIAVVGVTRDPKEFNAVTFRTLRERGYDAVPVNPNAAEIDGVRCFARVQDIEPPVEGAMVLTKADVTEQVVQDCREAGIKQVWLFGITGKPNSPGALELCRANGMSVVPGYCPHMFLRPTSWFHRLHGTILKMLGKYPA